MGPRVRGRHDGPRALEAAAARGPRAPHRAGAQVARQAALAHERGALRVPPHRHGASTCPAWSATFFRSGAGATERSPAPPRPYTPRDSMSSLQERTRFEPQEVEARISERWLASGLHHPEPAGTPAENFSSPSRRRTAPCRAPHGPRARRVNGSVQDTLMRYHRMRGRRAKSSSTTTRASPPRSRSSARSRQRARPARRWGASASSSACGSGPSATAARSSAR